VNTSVILTVNKDSGKYQWCNKLPEDDSQTSFYLLAYSTNRTGIFQSNISFTRPQFLWTSSTPLKFVTTYHGATRPNPMLGNSEIEPSLINILLWTHSGTCMKSAFFVQVEGRHNHSDPMTLLRFCGESRASITSVPIRGSWKLESFAVS
jgi:hypothetical protein